MALDELTTVKVYKYELYPETDSTDYAVGFTVTCDNGRNMGFSDTISLADASDKTEEEITDAVWLKVKSSVETWEAVAKDKSTLIGSAYTPT